MAQKSVQTPSIDLGSSIRFNKSTSLVEGGELSIDAVTSKFDIAAGNGEVVDNYTDANNPVYTKVIWTAFDAQTVTNLATEPVTFVGINSSGTVVQQATVFTEAQTRDIIVLGTLVHTDNTDITAIATVPSYAASSYASLKDFAHAAGALNLGGNEYSESGANLSLDKTTGKTFAIGSNYDSSKKSPNITIDGSGTALTFATAYQDGSGGSTFVAAQTVIDPDFYDDGDGTLGAMTATNYQIQRIFYNASTDETVVVYGQNQYASVALAEAELFTETAILPAQLAKFSLRAFLIVQEGVTDLTSAVSGGTAKFIPLTKYGGAGGAVGGVSLEYTTDGANNAKLWYDGALVAETNADGLLVKSSIDDEEGAILVQSGPGYYGELRHVYANDDFQLNNMIEGGYVMIQGLDWFASVHSLLEGNPNGDVRLTYDGSYAFRTASYGARVESADGVGTDGALLIYDGDDKIASFTKEATGNLIISNNEDSMFVELQGKSAISTVHTILSGDPDAATELFYNGNSVFETATAGIKITAPGSGFADFVIEDGSGFTGSLVKEDSGDFVLTNEMNSGNVQIAAKDAGGTERVIINASAVTGVDLKHAAVTKLSTTTAGATVFGSGHAEFVITDGDSQTATVTKFDIGTLRFENNEVGGTVQIRHNDAVAGSLNFLQSTPGGNTTLSADDGVAITSIVLDPVAEEIDFIPGGLTIGNMSSAGWTVGGAFSHEGAKVGFYNKNPAVQPTSVSANSTAIIAALKTLGIFG